MQNALVEYIGVYSDTNYTEFPVDDAVSISVIHGYLGGPDNRYYACNADNGLECYAVHQDELLQEIENSACPLMYFEELQTKLCNILCAVIHQKKEKGQHEHLLLYLVAQMTLVTVPKVGYARYFEFTGTSIAFFVLILEMFPHNNNVNKHFIHCIQKGI